VTAPTNDNIADAEVVVLTAGSYSAPSVDSTDATLETPLEDDMPGSASAWWKYTAEQDWFLAVTPSATGDFQYLAFQGPEPDDMVAILGDPTEITVALGTTLWFRMSTDAPGSVYSLDITASDLAPVGDLFDDPIQLFGEEGSMDLDLTNATLDSGEAVPSGVTRTLWGAWEPSSEDMTSMRFLISSGAATLRFYIYDPVGETITLVVADDTGPADLLVTDIDTTLEYRLQIGLGASDPDLTTLQWFSGAPSDYNSFAEALEIDGEYGSNILSLQNNDVEVGETVTTGVIATGWIGWEAPTTDVLNFQIIADPEMPYMIQVYSGTTLGGLTLIEQVESIAGEDVNFYVVMATGTQYYLQFGSAYDYLELEVGWSLEGVEVAPYVDPEVTEAEFEAYWDEGWDA